MLLSATHSSLSCAALFYHEYPCYTTYLHRLAILSQVFRAYLAFHYSKYYLYQSHIVHSARVTEKS